MIVFIAGAGSAGLGVAHQLARYKMRFGMTEEEAYETFYIFNDQGLITRKRAGLDMNILPLAQPNMELEGKQISEVIKEIKCNILIGLSGQGGIFTEEILKEMKDQPDGRRPIIFPLSNPTSKAECTPDLVQKATNYQAIFGSGSPFENQKDDQGNIIRSNQTNNSYIFPGLALGAVIGKCKLINEEMMMVASESLSECITFDDIKERGIFPKFDRIRDVSLHIACKVISSAVRQGLVRDQKIIQCCQESYEELVREVRSQQWQPIYRPYIYDENQK